jgi:hypothetical protein
MAAAAMTAAPGAEFLAQARGIQPGAKRVLVVPRGGPAAPRPVMPAGVLGERRDWLRQVPGRPWLRSSADGAGSKASAQELMQ